MYDVSIIGGGLAGLSLSILLSKSGYKILLLEKETYPFTKVCGEYISMESKSFIQSLGVDINNLNLPIIKRIKVSSPGGDFIEQSLDLGGFGVSRYFLDNYLKEIAIKCGVDFRENCKVENVEFKNNFHVLSTTQGNFESKICCGAFGKKSNIDVKLKRNFISESKLNNFVGIKYHLKSDNPDDLISLHNFEGGYCGISNVENNKSCLCYLTTADNLKKAGSIAAMERNILSKNKFLKEVLDSSEMLTG
ncbi:MAG: FAD-dependent monooxygenase, partial [Ferruginibacter sp.]